MPTWPGTLPQDQFLGTRDVRADATIRTQTRSGPVKARRRYTAAARLVPTPIRLTNAQRVTFDTFFITTLLEGSLSFDWEDPVTDAVASFLFLAPPEWRMVGDSVGRAWEAELQLQLLPA